LYHLACQDVTLDQLLQDAATPVGIYEDHLRRHWKNLSDSSSLAEAFLTVATATQPLRIGLIQTYQLYSMGLIHKQGDAVIPRCLLYRQYFQDQLKFSAISSSLA
ncbi:MAG: AAA-like domain-containing protein, partial [Thermosynechococcaceae cyanobacterium]